jgi:nucleoside phosphorylase/Tfp pilus assembly protein PilF
MGWYRRLRRVKGVDFVVITALEEERDELLSKFADVRLLEKDGLDTHTYYETMVPTSRSDGSSYRVIVSSLAGMGPLMAAEKAQAVVSRWHPEHVLLVGIACGVSGDAVQHGDVLIARQVADYTLGKIENEKRQIRWEVHPAGANLLDSVANLSVSWRRYIRHTRPAEGEPERRFGVVASGGDVIASQDVIDAYQQDWPKLVGIEMEGGGVASALHNTRDRPEFLMIKGVSDFGFDKKRADVYPWRPYAADAAASLALSLIQSGTGPSIATRRAIATRRIMVGVATATLVIIAALFFAISWRREQRKATVTALSNDAAIALQNGAEDEASKGFEGALGIDPEHAASHSGLSALAIRRGRLDEALMHAEAAAVSAPDVALYHYNVGVILAKLRRPEEALGRLHRAVKLDSRYVAAYNELGNVYVSLRRLADARDVLTRAYQLNPDFGPAAKNLGRVALREGNPTEALRWFGRAHYPRDDWRGRAELACWRAIANDARESRDDVCAELEQFRALDPNQLTELAPRALQLRRRYGCDS